MSNSETATSELKEPATYRLPVSLLDHLTFAQQQSELTKSAIVRRALREYLDANFPQNQTAAA